jgi:hypothetical protein
MKKLFMIIPALLGAMFLTSCVDLLGDNQSVDKPISTSVDQVLPVAVYYASQLCYDHAEYGVYMCQALTTGGKSQTGSYPYSQGWEFLGVNRHPMWRRHFYDLGANIQKMNELAEEKGYKNAILIGRTIMLMSTMMTTDAFGDMPHSQVYQSTSPAYDTQAEVYEWMFKEADELLKLYKDPTWTKAESNLLINIKMDRIYGGDLTKWEGFCKALKARLWLRKLPNWDNNAAVCNQIIQIADDALANFEEPQYHYPGGVTESNCPWGPLAPKINGWESRDNRLASSIPTTFFLHGILGGIDGTYQVTRGYALDPRAAKIMEPRNQVEGMLHLKSNIGMDISKTVSDYPDLLTQASKTNPLVANTSYIPLITKEELLFIKAEAQYWAGAFNEAYQTAMEGTKENMKRYGIEEATLKDHALNQYNRFFEIKFKETDFTLADLMQQKYVAMYLQPEQWTDMRRYNYSSTKNGIKYVVSGKAPVAIYDVKNVHNGANALFAKDAPNFKLTLSLERPYNLYEAYWCTPEDFVNGVSGKLTPNAWVNRLNADTETETKYNKAELDRMGYYTTNAAGEKILDYRILKKRLIWAKRNDAVLQLDDDVAAFTWM